MIKRTLKGFIFVSAATCSFSFVHHIQELSNKVEQLTKLVQTLNSVKEQQAIEIDGYKKHITKMSAEIKDKDNLLQQKEVELERLKKKQQELELEIKRNKMKQKIQFSRRLPRNKTITVEATAYTNHPSENGTYGGRVVTRTGYDITNTIEYQGYGIIATDPDVIPLNTVVVINGKKYIALDTGSAIRGNRIDVLVGSREEAIAFGRRTVRVIF
jgi:3D (Asp-Asp-Asp) domain-containing protein